MNTSASNDYAAPERFNIQQELDRIEEIVLESPRVPLSGKTMISEDELLDQLDVVRVNLPAAVQESVQIVQQREEILMEAEQYAQEIVTAAEKQAATILNEMAIVRQAEAQAAQLQATTAQECEALRSQTLGEIEQLQNQARQEWEETRTRTVTEARTIQEDADTYADQVLENMERQFMEMLHVLRNGRQQIQGGQSLDLETTAPTQRINPATGGARPVNGAMSAANGSTVNGSAANGAMPNASMSNGANGANGAMTNGRPPERPLLSRREATSPRQQLQDRPFAPDSPRSNS